MDISEAPLWIREFIERKAPWWLIDPLKVTLVLEDLKIAQVERHGFIYTLIPELYAIR